MTDRFNFKNELQEAKEAIKSCHHKTRLAHEIQSQENENLEQIETELLNIAEEIGVPLDQIINKNIDTDTKEVKWQWDDDCFLNYDSIVLEFNVKQQIFKEPELLPPLSKLDYAIVGITGLIASIIDFLIVKIPNDINYLNKYQQEGSNFTKWLKTLGLDENGQLNSFLKWCENTCKVSYDQSINPNIKGFNPKTHRLLSLGHDPLFGLIFGTLDILNGSMSFIDIEGKIQIIKTFDLSFTNKVFAPLIWLGHIVSDLCTKMGVPIPGWGFLQIMQFGLSGNNQTIAEISKWMYLNGYDLRHFITMSISVAVTEIIIRGYHCLSFLNEPNALQHKGNFSLADQEINQLKSNLKLHKMLFLAHTIAVTGNAVKIFTYHGNPLAININEWLFFLKETVTIFKTITRDKKPEKIIRNREIINGEWGKIRNINLS